MEVKVCIGSACHLKGSYDIVKTLEKMIDNNNLSDKLSLKSSFCLGRCVEAVTVTVNDKYYSVSLENIEEFFNENILKEA